MRAMSDDAILARLHSLEVRVLKAFSPDDEIDAELLATRLGYGTGQSNQVCSWLSLKGLLAEARRTTSTFYERTPLGDDAATNGTTAQRLLRAAAEGEPVALPELAGRAGVEPRDAGSAFGRLSKAGLLRMDDAKRVSATPAATDADPDRELAALLARAAETPLADAALTDDERATIRPHAKKRGAAGALFRIVERDDVVWRLTAAAAPVRAAIEAAGMTGDEAGQLTPEMLRDGSWRTATFRPYGVDAPTTRLFPGRRNPYSAYLDSVKDKLVSLGFEEFDGPLVETEFWNSDALFMPQFHSARDIHDVYYVNEPSHAREIEEPWLSRIAAAHENGWETGSRGWQYTFDRDFTRRQILRSQGTVMSAKTLHRAHVPGKYFGILRCFRYDQVDATHLADFYQTEGIVLGEDVNLETLLGLLRMFAEELAGATEVRYVPGYFPFTEPSVEVHIKHPHLGWFELGGSGIFRPEVTRPMGIDVPVLAWGLGIDRMALMHLGLRDLRELFGHDLERIRLRRAPIGV